MAKKGRDAELLVKGYLEDQDYTVHLAAASGMVKLGPRWVVKSHDLFGCIDALGFREDEPETWAVQVTTDSGRSKRRRKIEQHAWPASWRVSIVSHETERVKGSRSFAHYLKFQDYDSSEGSPDWGDYVLVPIDAKGIESRRKARDKAKKEKKNETKPEPGPETT